MNSLPQPDATEFQPIPKGPQQDAADLSLDPAVPPEHRINVLRAAIGDLHHFRVGEVTVELEFPENAPSLQEAFTTVLLRRQDSV